MQDLFAVLHRDVFTLLFSLNAVSREVWNEMLKRGAYRCLSCSPQDLPHGAVTGKAVQFKDGAFNPGHTISLKFFH